ncbi:facilitated trehalose transporter Tret1-like isoform X2 [Palaemon carinicauda]|uniref:facilitated trehalose transporter Tret1-like isoform X2 n=1 Tax=Palaemon carinicauda TaxID=392227 RepID=UPI0035B59AD9
MFLLMVLACLVASLGNLSATAVYGWTAATLPSMEEDPDLVMDTADIAWIASIISIGCVIGSIFAGKATDWIGRRTMLLVMAPILSGGWVIVAVAPNIAIVLLGRIICGISTAFVFSALSVYCAEVPEGRLRGRLGLIPSLFMTSGVVLSYIAGVFFSWRISCYICLAPLILMFLLLWAVPESPYWYLLKGRKDGCEASLRWLRGQNYDFSADVAEMEAKIKSVGNKVEYQELWKPRTRKPLLLSLFVATLQQFTPGNILISYAGLIFISAGVENHRMAILISGFLQILFTLLSVLTVDCVGRRPLLILSTFITGIAAICLALYYLLTEVLGIYCPLWIPIVSVLTAVSGYCIGCRTVPPLFAVELFNTTIRSTASSVYLFYNRLLAFAISQVYPFYNEAYGAHVVFFTFGGLSIVSCLVAFFVIPETKGKTLEQIQEHFESQKKGKPNSIHPSSEVSADTSSGNIL